MGLYNKLKQLLVYRIQHIAHILQADAAIVSDMDIEHLLIDSRKIVFPKTSLFFAIPGARRDGHSFMEEVYTRGVRNFVVLKGAVYTVYPDANFLVVNDVVAALQALAAWHRKQFHYPVIGITGSNGKTIVKEWLYQLLRTEYNIVRSPRSYNSQLGVPLSVWQMNNTHTLGLFEAGISTVHEMQKLEAVIQPTLGILTNIADAHDEGFASRHEKATEKAKLFRQSELVFYGKESIEQEDGSLFPAQAKLFSWSRNSAADLRILREDRNGNATDITAIYREKEVRITVPFTDRISVDNAITCWCVLLQLGYSESLIAERMLLLEPVEMRMQLKKAVNNCYLLNDSYSNDLSSLGMALDYLQQQAGKQSTTLILSDILQSGMPDEAIASAIAQELTIRGIHRFIGIGHVLYSQQQLLQREASGVRQSYYSSTQEFIDQLHTQAFRDEYILLKGARIFSFERISALLEQKVHQTVMEINLTSMTHNLKQYQALLKPTTKLMAMVKAFSYGSGSAEVARLLQFHKVDYLAVAYADEGVELRKAGISLPIMVMNTDEAAFDSLVTYDLEPEIFSFGVYHSFHSYLMQQGITHFPVHIKFNTGMNRLGFEVDEAAALARQLKQYPAMAVKTVFSHLVASEDPTQDAFTATQVSLFEKACDELRKELGYGFLQHIANTAAILRKPGYQFDMVRLGIGLYGVDSADGKGITLQTVATLKTTIAQLRKVKAGDTVGYGRKGLLTRDSLIATVRIGYADGFGREQGNGRGRMYLHGHFAPVVGNVCMDMTMIDVTDIPGVKEGDPVEVFGPSLPVQQVAATAGTIAYEVMTGISQRVKRVYLEE